MQILTHTSLLIQPYLSQCATAIVATLLVIYGGFLNNFVKRSLAPLHVIARTIIFILICAFGYGMLSVWLAPLLATGLGQIPLPYLAPSIASFFVLLGAIAQRQGQL